MSQHIRIRSKDLSRQWDMQNVVMANADSPSLRNSRLFNLHGAGAAASQSSSSPRASPFSRVIAVSPWLGSGSGGGGALPHHRSTSSSFASKKAAARRQRIWIGCVTLLFVFLWSAQTRVEESLGAATRRAPVGAPPTPAAAARPHQVEAEAPAWLPEKLASPPAIIGEWSHHRHDDSRPDQDTTEEIEASEAELDAATVEETAEAQADAQLGTDHEPSIDPASPDTNRETADEGQEAPEATRDDVDVVQTETIRPVATVSYDPPWILSDTAENLPQCEKVLLFQFLPWWGFASEWLLYLRTASLADKLGYTLLEDDSKWNYGRLSNYFKPRTIDCVPPNDWRNPKAAHYIGTPGWQHQSRVVYSRRKLSSLDDWTRETYLDPKMMQHLYDSNLAFARSGSRDILGEGDGLPAGLEEVFRDHANATSALWNVNHSLESEIEDAAAELQMTGKRITIAAHIRLGDKGPEYDHESTAMGITNTFGNLTVYLKGAHDALNRIVPLSSPLRQPWLQGASDLERPRPPTLVVMTAEAGVLSHLRRDSLLPPFELAQASSPAIASLKHLSAPEVDDGRPLVSDWAKALQNDAPTAYSAPDGATQDGKDVRRRDVELGTATPKSVEMGDLATGYSQSKFNKLPLLERVLHTRAFVRDLTLFSRDADAFIVSGASNIGRLAMLIGGYRATVGATDDNGRSLGGRIRSIDGHWFPTAYLDALYHPVVDKPDTAHRPVIPLAERRKGLGRMAKEA